MGKYFDMVKRHRKIMNDLPIRAAFNDKQFTEMMNGWGLSVEDTDKIYSTGCGSFYLKKDSKLINHTIEDLSNEIITNAQNDDEFFFEMCEYILNNHEYGYTRDLADSLDDITCDLAMTVDEFIEDDRMNKIFCRAAKKVIKDYIEWENKEG